MTTFRQRTLSAVVLAISLLVAGCEHLGIGVTSIGEIVRNPTGFEGRDVQLKGTVRTITKVPIVDIRTYVLADSSGEINVNTSHELPATGDKVVVRGKVSSAAVIGGQSLGLHVSERERAKSF